MRTYEVIETDGDSMVKATEGGQEIWIPMYSGNRHYAEYLRYTAWVEAGNDPQEFWTQEGEI